MLGARRGLLGGLALLVLLALLGGSAHADRLADRQAEANAVQAQLAQMDSDLAKAVEAYDAAQARLDKTEADIRDNALQLEVTRQNLQLAQGELSNQLVADYRSGDADTIGVLLGAASMSDMLERIDIVKRSSGRTAQLVGKVLTLKKQFEIRSKALAKQRKARAAALAGARRSQGRRSGPASRRARTASRRSRPTSARSSASARPPSAPPPRPGPQRPARRSRQPRPTRRPTIPASAARPVGDTALVAANSGTAVAAVAVEEAAAAVAPTRRSHRRPRPAARRSCRRRSRSSACPITGPALRPARASTAPA